MYGISRIEIALDTFLRIIAEQKTNYALEEDNDISIKECFIIVRAFVALGGQEGGKGGISKLKLKEVVEQEFGLQIDIDVTDWTG